MGLTPPTLGELTLLSHDRLSDRLGDVGGINSGKGHTVSRRTTTVRVARWSATHPWRAIGMWIAFVAVAFLLGGMSGTRKATNSELAVGETHRSTTILHEGRLDTPAVENVLVTARSGPFDRQQALSAGNDVAARMRGLDEVASVDAPVIAPAGDAVMVSLTMRGDPDKAGDNVKPLQLQTDQVAKAHPELRVEQTGAGSLNMAVNDRVTKDLGRSETLSLPVTLVILLVAFGAIIAAGVPVLLALTSVFAAIGLYGLASHVFPDNGSAGSLIMLMGMAVGVDYSLFYLKREREERRRGRGHIDAIEIAAATSGHSVLFSAFAVMVSMAGMYVVDDAIFSSLATGGILVVAVAMIGSLTVLPALLAKLGNRVDRPHVPVLWRLTNRAGEPRLWPALLGPALSRPGRTLAISIVILGGLAAPAFTMTLRNSGISSLPQSIPQVQSFGRLSERFPSETSSLGVAVRAPAGSATAVRSELAALRTRLAADAQFGSQSGEVRSSGDGRVHALTVEVRELDGSAAGRVALKDLRGTLLHETVGSVAGAQYAVSGDIASNVDYSDHMHSVMPNVVGFVLIFTFLLMAATFRSVVIGLTAIAVNLVSAGIAFGTLALVFQHSWAEGLLKFRSYGSVVSWIPLFLFAVLFGLSMDYHVFVVSRIKEAAERGMSTADAVRDGIIRSAGVVTSAAFVMISVFSVFGTLSMVEMKQMGVGLAVAVLIDALVIRTVVLPSIMILLGRANWWPGRLSRRVRRTGETSGTVTREAERALV